MRNLSTALKNLKNNFSFYALYLLSVSFVITVFFAFTSFSMNEVMLEKISRNGRVETMCSLISVFLMAFVVFYMAYSNRFFLRRRTKELGIYALLGYRKSAILSLLMAENLLSCLGAFAVGILLGALLHKGIVYGITKLLHLTIDHAAIPFFNPAAILRTASFILVIVLLLGLSNGRFLWRASLMYLVRFEKSAEKQIRFHAVPSILGLSAMIVGYGLALNILKGRKSVWFTVGLYPIGMLTLLLILSGTVLFIRFFLPFAVQMGKRNKRSFYTETRIITAPGFVYRMGSNARTLIMLSLLSAATLSISSFMALTLYYPFAAISRITPSEIECRLEKGSDISEIREIVSKYAAGDDVTFLQTAVYKVTSTASRLPAEYSIGTSKGDAGNEKLLRSAGFECISYSSYAALLTAQGREEALKRHPALKDGECILIKYEPGPDQDESGLTWPLLIGGEEIPVTAVEATLDNPISFANSVGTLIVSDTLYRRIAANTAPEKVILSIDGEAVKNQEALFQELSEYLQESPYLQGQSHRIQELIALNSSTFLLISFLVVLFFIAVGSILYFNNISAITDSKADYGILRKIGYTDRKIRHIIRKQTASFFSIPFLFGLADCIFATLICKTALMQNLLGSSLSLYMPAMAAILLTFAIYLLYYCVTIRASCKVVLT